MDRPPRPARSVGVVAPLIPGTAHLQRHDWSAALLDFEAAVARGDAQPAHHVRALVLAAAAFAALAQPQAALTVAAEARRVRPQTVAAWLAEAAALEALGDVEGALDRLDHALALGKCLLGVRVFYGE